MDDLVDDIRQVQQLMDMTLSLYKALIPRLEEFQIMQQQLEDLQIRINDLYREKDDGQAKCC